MKEHLVALFRTCRDAVDSTHLLAEEQGLVGSSAVYVFPLGPSPHAAAPMCEPYEIDHAQYAGHGEQVAMMSINHFSAYHEPSITSRRSGEERLLHALVVIVDPPDVMFARLCEKLKDCGAYAIRLPSCRWHLCYSRLAHKTNTAQIGSRGGSKHRAGQEDDR